MNNLNFNSESSCTLWIQHLVNGLSGLTIKVKNNVYCDSSPFQKIEIFDTYDYGLVLCLGGSIVMTERDNFIYNEMIVHPSMLMHPEPKKICIIGGGDGGGLKEILKHPVVSSVKIIEIDKMVTDIIYKFYPALAEGLKDERVDIIYDDGNHYLENNKDTFDIIIVDSYNSSSLAQSLETIDFYRIVSQRLSKEGIVVIQTDSPTVRKEYLMSTMLSVSSFFPVYRPYISFLPSFPDGICSFLMCSHSEAVLDNFYDDRYANIADICEYYNEEIHRSIFSLPQYIKNLFN